MKALLWFFTKSNGGSKLDASHSKRENINGSNQVSPTIQDHSVRKPAKCYIKNVPSEIFPLIQIYLKEHDYALLLSTNMSIFKEIRKQTIRFIVSLGNMNFDRCIQEGKKVLQFLRQRGYSEKQIILKAFGVTNENIDHQNDIKLTGFYSIKLIFAFVGVFNDLNITCLNGNQQIFLSSFVCPRFLGKIENIYSISLEQCGCLHEIVGPWNEDGKLKQITIVSCHNLTTIPEIHNVEDVYIKETSLPHLSISGTKLKSLYFDFISTPMTSCTWMHSDLFMNLQKLYLRGIFPKEINFSVLTLLMNVPNLTLISHSQKESNQPALPFVFLGKKLELNGFNLSMWNEQCLPHATSITLLNSFQLTHLPDLPQANHVTLKSLHELQFMPLSIPTCRRFEMYHCHSVVRLPSLGNLSSVIISSCDSLSDLSSLNDLIFQSVSIKHCPALVNVTPLRNAHVLELSGCIGVTAFKHFDQSLLPARERSFSLMTCENVRDFSGLGHIRELSLFMLDRLTDGGGIHDVEMLNVMKCSNVTKITNIHNVKSVTVI